MTEQNDPHGYIGGVDALIFVFTLSLVAIGAGAAIVGAILWSAYGLWVIASALLGLGIWYLVTGLRSH